jgi:hypothetical protein
VRDLCDRIRIDYNDLPRRKPHIYDGDEEKNVHSLLRGLRNPALSNGV